MFVPSYSCSTLIWRVILHSIDSVLVGYTLDRLTFQTVGGASHLFILCKSVAYSCALFVVIHGVLVQKTFSSFRLRFGFFPSRVHSVLWSLRRTCNDHNFGKQLCREVCYLGFEGWSRGDVFRLSGDHQLVLLHHVAAGPLSTKAHAFNESPAAEEVTVTEACVPCFSLFDGLLDKENYSGFPDHTRCHRLERSRRGAT